jgi:GNAT superfamily N-acetyltransferase
MILRKETKQMHLINNNLAIRNATAADAEQLCTWWNDGTVMAHAGFPNGVGDTPERIRESLAGDSDDTHRRHIIELSDKPIGEMNYRNKGNAVAEIGNKICYADERENSWTDQLGVFQSSIDYDLRKADWLTAHTQMEYVRFAPVTSADEKSTICNHILRALPNWFGVEESIIGYVKEVCGLTFFAAFSADNAAVGFAALKPHNEYTEEVCVMGVLRDFHRHGIGKQLIALCDEDCRHTGRVFLTVKTLDQSRASQSYEKTRMFYRAQGFCPLEVFPLLWDENNPCLFMAKYLGGSVK